MASGGRSQIRGTRHGPDNRIPLTVLHTERSCGDCRQMSNSANTAICVGTSRVAPFANVYGHCKVAIKREGNAARDWRRSHLLCLHWLYRPGTVRRTSHLHTYRCTHRTDTGHPHHRAAPGMISAAPQLEGTALQLIRVTIHLKGAFPIFDIPSLNSLNRCLLPSDRYRRPSRGAAPRLIGASSHLAGVALR